MTNTPGHPQEGQQPQKKDPVNYDLRYYLGYLEKCWASRQYYKDEENKLLYWVGTSYVALVAASGLLGAIKAKDTVFSFGLFHILAFHMAFTVAWYFYLYKKLNTGIFGYLGEKVEEYLEKTYGIKPPCGFPSFFRVKTCYLGKPVSCGRGLSRAANMLIGIVYIGTVSYPVFRGSFSKEGIVVNWEFLVALVVFLCLVLGGHWMYKRENEKIRKVIDQQWTL